MHLNAELQSTSPTHQTPRVSCYEGNVFMLKTLFPNDLKNPNIPALFCRRSVDENVQKSVAGIADYFGTLAKFDQGIAQQDVGYIDGKLAAFRTKTTSVQSKLKGDVDKLMGIVQAALVMNLITEITRLAMVVAENSNPFKVTSFYLWKTRLADLFLPNNHFAINTLISFVLFKVMFTGVDVDAIFERTLAVAAATAKVATGAKLIKAVKDLASGILNTVERANSNSPLTRTKSNFPWAWI